MKCSSTGIVNIIISSFFLSGRFILLATFPATGHFACQTQILAGLIATTLLQSSCRERLIMRWWLIFFSSDRLVKNLLCGRWASVTASCIRAASTIHCCFLLMISSHCHFGIFEFIFRITIVDTALEGMELSRKNAQYSFNNHLRSHNSILYYICASFNLVYELCTKQGSIIIMCYYS